MSGREDGCPALDPGVGEETVLASIQRARRENERALAARAPAQPPRQSAACCSARSAVC